MSDTKQLPFGRYVDGVITRSWSDLEKKIGSATIPVIQLVLQFDDDSLPDGVNGKELLTMVRLDGRAPILKRFCSFLDLRGILSFEEKHTAKSKLGGYTAMSDHLIENIDDITGVWDEEAKVLKGGKLVGQRLSFLVNKMTAWHDPKAGRNYPNNWRLLVHHPKDTEEDKPVIFNIFEVSHIREDVVKGDKFDESLTTQEVPEDIDSEPEDDVRWSYEKEESSKSEKAEVPF